MTTSTADGGGTARRTRCYIRVIYAGKGRGPVGATVDPYLNENGVSARERGSPKSQKKVEDLQKRSRGRGIARTEGGLDEGGHTVSLRGAGGRRGDPSAAGFLREWPE